MSQGTGPSNPVLLIQNGSGSPSPPPPNAQAESSLSRMCYPTAFFSLGMPETEFGIACITSLSCGPFLLLSSGEGREASFAS